MKSKATEAAASIVLNSAGVLNRICTSLIRTFLLNLIAQLALGTPVAAQTPDNFWPERMERQQEIALALSACPASIASETAVYVLEKKGYGKIRESENGFTAIVQHSLPTSQEPQCMDAEGSHTFLPHYLKVAEWRARGKSSDEILRLVADGFAKGIFQPPARPGVDYMLWQDNLVPNAKGEVTHFPPHVMFYAPYLTNADLGATEC